MKLKYYLRGLGIGIIVTTLILTISFNTKRKMTDEEVINRAKQLGMVEPDNNLFENRTTGESESDKEQPSTDKPTEKETEKTTEKQTEKETEPVTEAPTEEKTEAYTEYTLYVDDYTYSESVAAMLYENGIVDDEDAFHDFLANNGYEERIISGEFKLNSNMSYQDIADIICN